MKKSLLLLSALSLGWTVSNAQVTISNGNFNEWVSGSPWGNFSSWNGTDKLLKSIEAPLIIGGYAGMGMIGQQVFQETELAYEGGSAAKLVTKDLGGDLGPTPAMIANGVMEIDAEAALSGEIESLESIMQISGGTYAAGKKVDSLTAYVRGLEELNADQSSIIVRAQQISGDTMITIGAGTINFEATNEFKKVVVPMEYVSTSNTATDTFVIMIISSANIPTEEPEEGESMFGATADNTLLIDDINVFVSEPETSHIADMTLDLGVQVYPNPATNFVIFQNKNLSQAVIQIYDVSGKIMHQEFIGKSNTKVDLNQYASGTYFYEIIDLEKNNKQVGKFVK